MCVRVWGGGGEVGEGRRGGGARREGGMKTPTLYAPLTAMLTPWPQHDGDKLSMK